MTTPEFSRAYRIDTIGGTPRTVEIAANEAERAALARRFGLLAIERLDAQATVTRADAVVSAAGSLSAAVVQACVATGEPLPARIDAPFALTFVPEETGTAPEEVELDESDLDKMGYDGGQIDLGEAVAQTLALALDPFPRAPEAGDALRAAGVIGEDEAGPFGALRALRDRL